MIIVVTYTYLSKIKISVFFHFADLNLPRYKFVVSVVLGEQRGEGVKVGARCLWDADTDNYASDVFLAVSFMWLMNY